MYLYHVTATSCSLVKRTVKIVRNCQKLSVCKMSSAEHSGGHVAFQNQFPSLENGKIATVPFLEASKQIVQIVDKLGKLFIPVKSDINGNIEKINKIFQSDTTKFHYLHDMILQEKSDGSEFVTDALLWLTRALHFMETFLDKIFSTANDENCTENLNTELTYAYTTTLKNYHGWLNQKAFLLICRMCPTRSDFLKSLGATDEDKTVLCNLNVFLRSLRINRIEINRFYEEHKLESNKVV